MNAAPIQKRTIRSFVRRTGRLTPAQERALRELWPGYGIDSSNNLLDIGQLFGRNAARTLEIGFGNGESMLEQAEKHPERDFIGIEVHEPGVGHCLLHADRAGINNLRVASDDAIEVLQQRVPDASLDRVNLYFPDPWPKKRHHKRRIVQASFLELVAAKLVRGGTFRIATDWENYAEHIDETIAASHHLRLLERREHGGDRPLDRPTTKFEQRGLRKGHAIWDWCLEKI